MMLLVVTMAGLGTRFRQAGYQEPKYRIRVAGRTLFSWALESLRRFLPDGRLVFVALRQDDARAFIADELAAMGVAGFRMVELDQVTDGQATSALAAGAALDGEELDLPLLVYNIDTYVDPRQLGPELVRGDGWVPCFPGAGEAWSFFRADAAGRVEDAAEKRRISPHASIGLYTFRSFRSYQGLYERFFHSVDAAGLKERYIAPLYRQMLREGLEVYLHQLPLASVHPLGTPEEVARFAPSGESLP